MSDEEENKEDCEEESEEACSEGLRLPTSEGEDLAREERSGDEEGTKADEGRAEGEASYSQEAGDEQSRDPRLLRNGGQEVDAEADYRTEDGVPPCLRTTWHNQRRYARRWNNL